MFNGRKYYPELWVMWARKITISCKLFWPSFDRFFYDQMVMEHSWFTQTRSEKALNISAARFCLVIPMPEFIDPRIRENKPKTPEFSHWKRALCACFRENWVYNFGHYARECEDWITLSFYREFTSPFLIGRSMRVLLVNFTEQTLRIEPNSAHNMNLAYLVNPNWLIALKRVWHEIFIFGFFHKSVSLVTLNTLYSCHCKGLRKFANNRIQSFYHRVNDPVGAQ
jgi:hypothetical protein